MYVVGVRTEGVGALSGKVLLFNDKADGSWGSRYEVPLPFGVTTTNGPVSTCWYEGRTYICGGYSYNLMLDEHHRLWKQGMRAPVQAPVIAGPGAGTYAIAYLSWYDELTGERSPLSEGTALAAGARTWTLPARPPDETLYTDDYIYATNGITIVGGKSSQIYTLRPGDRVAQIIGADKSYTLVTSNSYSSSTSLGYDSTGELDPVSARYASFLPMSRATHIELWLSVAGGLPSLIMRLAVGTTTVTENTAASDLGETFIGAFERFPRCTMNVIWNDRQIMAGDPENPDTLYLSDTFQPERYAGKNMRTRGGDFITGILALRDYVLVFTRTQTYMLQGYSDNDLNFTCIEQSLGSIGHLCNKVVHGMAYVWTVKGPYMYNGSWHPLSPENTFTTPTAVDGPYVRATLDPDQNMYFVQGDGLQLVDKHLPNFDYVIGGSVVDKPRTNTGEFEANQVDQGYIIGLDYTTVQPETGGTFGPARLVIDRQQAIAGTQWISKSICYYHYLANKWGIGRLYTLSKQTFLDTNSFRIYPHRSIKDSNIVASSAGPSVKPTFAVLWGHNYFQEPGGNFVEGKTFRNLWVDARVNNDTSTIQLFPGDDDAMELLYGYGKVNQPAWPDAFTLPNYKQGGIETNLIHPLLIERATGRGLSILFKAPDLGLGASFRGFGGVITPGPATRYLALVQTVSPKYTARVGGGAYLGGNPPCTFIDNTTGATVNTKWTIGNSIYYGTNVTHLLSDGYCPSKLRFTMETSRATGGTVDGVLTVPAFTATRTLVDGELQTWKLSPVTQPGVSGEAGSKVLGAGYSVSWYYSVADLSGGGQTPDPGDPASYVSATLTDVEPEIVIRVGTSATEYPAYMRVRFTITDPTGSVIEYAAENIDVTVPGQIYT